MPIKTIQSRSDSQIKKLRLIRDGEDKNFIFAEGPKLLEELFKSSIEVSSIFYVRDKESEMTRLLKKYNAPASIALKIVAPQVMEFVSDLKSFPGIIAVGKRPKIAAETKIKPAVPLILILNGLQLPQNVGAIIRTAEAAGVSEVWLTSNTADPFNPKSLRASAGSVFRLLFRTFPDLAHGLNELEAQKIQFFGASQTGQKNFDEINWTLPTALVVSREGGGFSESEIKSLQNTIKIPMAGKVESLNVVVAAGICLFEASKQRRISKNGIIE